MRTPRPCPPDATGFDPIWFGVIFIIMMEIGYMTPPFGFNLFYIKGWRRRA